MKKYIILSMICLAFLSCKAQVTQIVPLKSFTFEYDTGVYKKDLNNELAPLVGTWEGTLDNKKYIFTFTLFTQHQTNFSDDFYYYEDVIKGKYKVIDLNNNQVLYDNTQVINYEDYSLTDAGGIFNNDYYIIIFRDDETRCFNSVSFYLKPIANTSNQITYVGFFYNDYGTWDGCPNYQNQEDIPMFLPKDTFTLTKQ